MIIGIPREILENERRVAALPENVAKYAAKGYKVLVEASAGEGALRSDDEYRKAGAEIVTDKKALFSRSDVILKVKQPTLDGKVGMHEVEMLREGTILVTFLHPAAPPNHGMVRKLCERNITAFTMDGIPRTSRAQMMDALTSMSTITGYKSVIIAANRLPKFIPMIGTAIGTIKPAAILVVGAGVVGLQAIATAKRLGGVVKVVEIRDDARKSAESLGAKVVWCDVPAELALGEGGYARALPPGWLEKERAAIKPLAAEADIIILCALVPSEVAPILLTDEIVCGMKPGSVIVDVSIDQGGNCALTEAGQEVVKHGVLIYGALNIPGSMPVHSSWLYANNMMYFIENMFKKGGDKPDMEDDIVKHALVTHQRKIMHQGALKAMNPA